MNITFSNVVQNYCTVCFHNSKTKTTYIIHVVDFGMKCCMPIKLMERFLFFYSLYHVKEHLISLQLTFYFAPL